MIQFFGFVIFIGSLFMSYGIYMVYIKVPLTGGVYDPYRNLREQICIANQEKSIIMSDCNECGGSGKTPTYREPARKITEEPVPKKEWKMDWGKVRRYGGMCVFVACMLSLVGLAGYGVRACNKETAIRDAKREEYENRMGYIVVLYDANANVARCWITGWYRTYHSGNASYTYEPNYPVKIDHLGSIEVYDRNNVDIVAAKKIGVNDPSTCIR